MSRHQEDFDDYPDLPRIEPRLYERLYLEKCFVDTVVVPSKNPEFKYRCIQVPFDVDANVCHPEESSPLQSLQIEIKGYFGGRNSVEIRSDDIVLYSGWLTASNYSAIMEGIGFFGYGNEVNINE